MNTPHITSIVITGGPCAGKTTGMSYLSQKLSELGYAVVIVPEFATELIMAGLMPHGNISLYHFNQNLIAGQIEKEKRYLSFAKHLTAKKVVILFDRGVLDAKAYVTKKEWQSLLKEMRKSEITLRDTYYDAVIHMRTAAFGKEEYYTTENNKARYEKSLTEARETDERTLASWIGHSHLRVVDNRDDFASKMHRVLKEVLRVLGEPIPLEIERKYLIDPLFNWKTIPVPYQEIDIEQAYLEHDGRIRRRGLMRSKSFVYTETHKRDVDNGLTRTEIEWRISKREWYEKLQLIVPGSTIIRKKRICFVHQQQYFELDTFRTPHPSIYLEIELTEENTEIHLPPWIPVLKEVTTEKCHTNRAISLRSCEV